MLAKTVYTYDKLNCILSITEPTGKYTSYTYDDVGNRESESFTLGINTIVNTYSYDDQNRLIEVSSQLNNELSKTTSYTYDNNGNQLVVTEKEFNNQEGVVERILQSNTYDELNQLVKTVTNENVEVINSYDSDGLRVAKEVDGNRTYYLYENNNVILELDGLGNQRARNIYGANMLMRDAEDALYYYMYNGHADVTALVDEAGNIAATYYYDAFGNIVETSGSVYNYIQYAGYQYDKETELYYLNARMYDAKIARFMQEDTYLGEKTDPLSLNLYTYCSNNPIKYSDPTGHRQVIDANGDVTEWPGQVGFQSSTIELIKDLEGTPFLTPRINSNGTFTIGYGYDFTKDGDPDMFNKYIGIDANGNYYAKATITETEAEITIILSANSLGIITALDKFISGTGYGNTTGALSINQNQYDALFSYFYSNGKSVFTDSKYIEWMEDGGEKALRAEARIDLRDYIVNNNGNYIPETIIDLFVASKGANVNYAYEERRRIEANLFVK